MSVLIKTIRAYQWPKNLIVFAALIFAQQFDDPSKVLRSCIALAAFCAVSSAVYIINDILDIEKDRLHPEKSKRPLPSGRIGIGAAVTISAVCAVIGFALSYWLGPRFMLGIGSYFGLVVAYSVALKHQPIIDVMVLALGFVIRAVSGALALDVAFSNWLVVCTLFLALFLALSKRRHELAVMDVDALNHRAVLIHYSVPYLDALILIMACATLLTYTIYTCSPEVVQRLGTDKLYITIPFVVYGLFRYLYLVQLREGGGDPSRTLLRDKPMMFTVLAWACVCVLILLMRENA
jgi:4-hydroxybenzoate polyprenyltransferase